MTSDLPSLELLVQQLERMKKQNRTLRQCAVALGIAFCASLILLLTTSVTAQDRQPVFYLGGERLFVGMSKTEVIASLSACCKLSPPAEEEHEQMAADAQHMLGHFILPKDGAPGRILGTVFFSGGKVLSVTRPLGDEDYAPWSDDVVGFARTFYRALSPTTGVSDKGTVFLAVGHERMKNADTETLSFAFPNGRGVRFNLIHLDRALPNTPVEFGGDKTEQVTLEEFLEQPIGR
jgi:hypothetical protein